MASLSAWSEEVSTEWDPASDNAYYGDAVEFEASSNGNDLETIEFNASVTKSGYEEAAELAEASSIEDVRYNLIFSLYTRHFNPDPEHNNDQNLIGIERQSGDTLWGALVFNNSFYQDSQYVYWGKEFRLDNYMEGLRSKWTFGLLHGYKDEYEDKMPFNHLGIAPVIIPSIGYTTRYLEADVFFLGLNAVTVTATIPLRF